MPDPDPTLSGSGAPGVAPEALLARASWVRALAARLAADAHGAEDLAQETLLVAARRRPAEGVPLERWLARVARNLHRSGLRAAGRRDARERALARAEADTGGDPADLLIRLEAHRELVEAVRALEEPYRGTLLLRWFEGLSPRAIARQTGVPVRTVHTRLARGLARLRSALDRPERPLAAWLPLFGPLPAASVPVPPSAASRAPVHPVPPAPGAAAPAGTLLAPLLGGLAVQAHTKLLIGAAAFGGLFLAVRAALPPSPATPPAVAPLADTSAPLAPTAPAASSPAAPADVRAAARSVAAGSPAAVPPQEALPAPAPTATLTGRAVDLEGRPVAELTVGFSGHGAADAKRSRETTTGQDGSFALEVPAAARPEGASTAAPWPTGRVEVIDPGFTAVFEPVVQGGPLRPAGELLLVVGPLVELAGRVVDERGLGVPGAEVLVAVPSDARRRFGPALEGSSTRSWSTRTDGRGDFALEALGAAGAHLHTEAGGKLPDVRPAPERSDTALEIVLRTPERDRDRLVGTVVDAAGDPVEGAHVALGYASARSGPDGGFVLRLDDQSDDTTLAALIPGRLPALLECSGDDPLAEGAWPDPLVLRLGGEPLALSGRVLDERGRPLEGLEVQLLAPTEFGPVEVPGRKDMTMLATAEALLAGGGHASAPVARTGVDGRFELTGLLERDYQLRVVDRQQPSWADFGPFPAGGAGLTLRLPAARTRPLLAGRVLSLSGAAVPGLWVRPLVPIDGPPSPGELGQVLAGRSVPVDAEGRFELRDVALDVTQLEATGPSVGLGQRLELPPGADPEGLEFRVAASCRFQVELDDPRATSARFELLDGAGEPLTLARAEGAWGFTSASGHLSGGRSELLSAPETAALLVVQLSDGERLELPVRLAPGEVTVLRR